MADQELKALNCPFCGSSDIARHNTSIVSEYMQCAQCHTEGPVASSRADAIAAWNNRAEPVGVPTVQAGDDILIAAARKTGLRGHLTGVNTQHAKDTLRKFVDEIAQSVAPSQPVAGKDAVTSIDDWQETYLPGEDKRSVAEKLADSTLSDPLDWPIPCDITVGAGTIKKGCALRTVVERMKVLHGMALTTANAGKEVTK